MTMTPQEMMDKIDEAIGPDVMTKSEAWDWLLDLKSLIDDQLNALGVEIEDGL